MLHYIFYSKWTVPSVCIQGISNLYIEAKVDLFKKSFWCFFTLCSFGDYLMFLGGWRWNPQQGPWSLVIRPYIYFKQRLLHAIVTLTLNLSHTGISFLVPWKRYIPCHKTFVLASIVILLWPCPPLFFRSWGKCPSLNAPSLLDLGKFLCCLGICNHRITSFPSPALNL